MTFSQILFIFFVGLNQLGSERCEDSSIYIQYRKRGGVVCSRDAQTKWPVEIQANNGDHRTPNVFSETLERQLCDSFRLETSENTVLRFTLSKSTL